MEELYKAVNKYLENPTLDADGRKCVVANEAGPYRGNAGKIIGEHILSLVHSN
jgi:hypothetical protein